MLNYFTEEEIIKCREPHPYDLTNEVLYELCKKHPSHLDDQSIIAKTFLIGRSYAAALERHKNLSGVAFVDNDTFYEMKVVDTFKYSDLDQRLVGLKEKVLSKEDLETEIVDTHSFLVKILKDLTNHKKRSFSSKYLHFHLPELYFIYDSRVCNIIKDYVPKPTTNCKTAFIQRLAHSQYTPDDEYLSFYLRSMWLVNAIKEKYGVTLSPRQLDNLLIEKANNKLRNS